MNEHEGSVFYRAGFKPPQTVWTKPDPRGAEYGEFRAWQSGEKMVSVVWRAKDDGRSYSFEIAADQFVTWANECS